MASNTISILVTAKDNASQVLRGVSNELDNGSGHASRFGGALKSMAATATVAFAAAAAGAGVFAIKSAADYEQSLNVFRSVSGATAAQMRDVAATAKQLGNDITLPGISAKDAALAMVELAKAGLSVNDTLAASKGVLSLAKAGQLETAQAAEITANALNAFSLKGTEASRVADLLAAAANASSADVTDMAYALQMSSAGAAAVKVPVEDLTTAIAQMANNGIKGSDAGTSLKSMFMNLIPTTTRAKDSMRQLNLDFYDAKGNFVGMRELVKQLQAGTKDLTDEQKAQHIENIFGADSMRAANILMKEGVDGYDKLRGAVTKVGAAQAMAAAQNAGFKGSLDALKSSVETLAIDIGLKMLPSLTAGLTALGGGINALSGPFLAWIDQSIASLGALGVQVWDYLGPKVRALITTIQTELVPAFTRVWEAIQPLLPVLGVIFVGAVGAVIDIIHTATILFSGFINELMNGNPVLWLLIGTFGALKAAMMLQAAFSALSAGFSLLTTMTIPSLMARVAALNLLISTPMVMPALAIAAALASLYQVVQAVMSVKGAIDALNSAASAKAAAEVSNADAIARIRASNQSEAWKSKKISEISSGGRAMGGPVAQGRSYIVGENGPELFTPASGGSISSNGSSAGSVIVNITGPVSFQNRSDIDYFAERINKTQRLARLGMA